MGFLRSLPEFRACWQRSFRALAAQWRRSHLERRVLQVHRAGLCTFPEALCALVETGADDVEAVRRLRNEQYRREMCLAAEVIAKDIAEWSARPRVNSKWAARLLGDDGLVMMTGRVQASQAGGASQGDSPSVAC